MSPVARLEPFDARRFLSQFWQRRPCLIPGWLEPSPLLPAELMTLAAKHELPARLITGSQVRADWTVVHGPLDDHDLPRDECDWTVLVQEVDKVSEPVAALLTPFRRFLPDWMLDDIMISQAVPGGSVGAHVDAYDVFLVQAAGTRRWELSTRFDGATDDRFELAVLEQWCPETVLDAGPGDTLYLPAGIAHHGVAVSRCQTWSVGLRTPSAPEMMFHFAETLAADADQAPRLAVPHPDSTVPARIDADTVRRARGMLQAALECDDEQLSGMLAGMLSGWRLWTSDDDPTPLGACRQQLESGHAVALHAGARIALAGQPGRERLFVNGEPIGVPPELARDLAVGRCLNRGWLMYPEALDQLFDLAALA